MPVLESGYGNPSSLHWFGRQAKVLLETSRSQVASRIGAQPQEIFFTSGATEADNLALFGVAACYEGKDAHLITSSIEHHAVLHAAQRLEENGWQVTCLPVGKDGLVNAEDVARAIRPATRLISLMMVNNETGTIQPVREVGEIARSAGILFHTDAVQGLGLLPVSVDELGVDLLSLSGHKIYGPKGAGALYIRQGTQIKPVLVGGPQENEYRAGTENLPGIVGLGAAAVLCEAKHEKEFDRLLTLRKYFLDGLGKRVDRFQVNGAANRVSPHVISVTFLGSDGEMMLFLLDKQGIAVSMGSACNAKTVAPSHVLLAMGLSPEDADATLRISMGSLTSRADMDHLLEVLPQVVEQCRQVK